MPKINLEFPTIKTRLDGVALPEVDAVVGVATGGTVPAALVAYRLGLPLALIYINYRAPDNRPQRPAPELLEPPHLPTGTRRILLVDDVSVTGRTVECAKGALSGYNITTLVFKGHADIVLFPDIASCVVWPWAPVHKNAPPVFSGT